MIGWIIISILVWLCGLCPLFGFIFTKIKNFIDWNSSTEEDFVIYFSQGFIISLILAALIIGIIFIIKGI
jgi:hypothetical protein